MAEVYLVQQLKEIPGKAVRDLNPVLAYGAITTLIEPGDNPAINSETVRDKVANRLANFNAEVDYLVWVGGDPVGILIVTSELLRRGIKRFCWLRYSFRLEKTEYLPVWIDLTRPPKPWRKAS